MRLRSLRKERPAFENEGVVISGNRIDLPNSDFKLPKYCANNRFTSLSTLNNESSGLRYSSSIHTPRMNTHFAQQTPTYQRFLLPSPVEATHLPSYQAIETTYLEHGIRINLNPTTTKTVTDRNNQKRDHASGRSSTNGIQRHNTFIHRSPSRLTSPLHYLPTTQNINLNSRPLDPLQRTSTANLEPLHASDISHVQSSETEHQLQPSEPLHNNYCSSSSVASEHFDQITPCAPVDMTNDKPSLATLIGNDPDLAYMSSLLQSTNGASSRNAICRRPGLRLPPPIYRHSQLTTTINSNQHEISSSTKKHSSSLLRHATIATVPSSISPSKKLEKDIVKHAARIRIHRSKATLNPYQNFSKSHTDEDILSMTGNSSTRLHHLNRQNQTLRLSKPISLEPLKLLLASGSRSSPRPSPSRVTSLLSYDIPGRKWNNYQENKKPTEPYTNLFVGNNNNGHDDVASCGSNEHLKSSSLHDESLSIIKTCPTDIIANNKIPSSNSFDSGYYDRSSNYSGDTHSITSLSINQALSSTPSARFTNGSTRRSTTHKKVSFEDQSLNVIITTSTYV